MEDGNSTLSFARLVCGSLVHRSHLGDVLVTDGCKTGDDRFECAAQWPANHVLLGRAPGPDSALIAETTRQVTAYVAHVMYNVPLGYQFLMTRLETATTMSLPSPSSMDLTVTVTIEQTTRSRTGLSRFVSSIELCAGGRMFASGRAHARVVDPVAYARSRSSAPPWPAAPENRSIAFSPLPAERVGVLDRSLVVVAALEPPGAYEFFVDTSSSVFFDHPVDHVPGMAIIEGIRQAARDVSGHAALDFLTMDMSFHTLVEVDRPAVVVLTRVGTDQMDAAITQDDRRAASGSVMFRPAS